MSDERNCDLNDDINALQCAILRCLNAVAGKPSPDEHLIAAQAVKEYASAIIMLKALESAIENTF